MSELCVTLLYVYPHVKLYELPRCEATVTPEIAQYRHAQRVRGRHDPEYQDDQCNRRAKYDVNGKKLCRRHAEGMVLDMVVRASEGLPR
jgi:hypothetical protein